MGIWGKHGVFDEVGVRLLGILAVFDPPRDIQAPFTKMAHHASSLLQAFFTFVGVVDQLLARPTVTSTMVSTPCK